MEKLLVSLLILLLISSYQSIFKNPKIGIKSSPYATNLIEKFKVKFDVLPYSSTFFL